MYLLSTYYIPDTMPSVLPSLSHLTLTSTPPPWDFYPLLVLMGILGFRIYKAGKTCWWWLRAVFFVTVSFWQAVGQPGKSLDVKLRNWALFCSWCGCTPKRRPWLWATVWSGQGVRALSIVGVCTLVLLPAHSSSRLWGIFGAICLPLMSMAQTRALIQLGTRCAWWRLHTLWSPFSVLLYATWVLLSHWRWEGSTLRDVMWLVRGHLACVLVLNWHLALPTLSSSSIIKLTHPTSLRRSHGLEERDAGRFSSISQCPLGCGPSNWKKSMIHRAWVRQSQVWG